MSWSGLLSGCGLSHLICYLHLHWILDIGSDCYEGTPGVRAGHGNVSKKRCGTAIYDLRWVFLGFWGGAGARPLPVPVQSAAITTASRSTRSLYAVRDMRATCDPQHNLLPPAPCFA
jgi:hypothetical protein